MNGKRGLGEWRIGRVWLLGLLVAVGAPGCLLGVAPPDAAIGKWQFVKTYINDDTRPLIGNIFQAQAGCRAYLEASKVGAHRAGDVNTTLLLISGIAALLSSALSGFAGMKSATTQGGLSETPREGHPTQTMASLVSDARTAKITAIVAAVTTLVVGVATLVSNTVGPSKTREAFLTSIGDFQSHLQAADGQIDQFNNLMSKSATADAANALRAALSELNKCDGQSQNLDVDLNSIAAYEKKAAAQYTQIVESVAAANAIGAVATAITHMTDKPEFGPYPEAGSPEPSGLRVAELEQMKKAGEAAKAAGKMNGLGALAADSAVAPRSALPASAAERTLQVETQAASIAGGLAPDEARKRAQVLNTARDLLLEDKIGEAQQTLKDNGIQYQVTQSGLPALNPH